MKVCYDISLTEFEFWSGGKDKAKYFTFDELIRLENFFDEVGGDEPVSDGFINDVFWFEPETLCEYLGIDYENDYLKR